MSNFHQLEVVRRGGIARLLGTLLIIIHTDISEVRTAKVVPRTKVI